MEKMTMRASRRLRAAGVRTVHRLPQALGALGFTTELVAERTTRDLYLDTEDWAAYRAGVACRLRLSDDGKSVAVEPLSAPEGASLELTREERMHVEPESFPGPIPGESTRVLMNPVLLEALVFPRMKLLREETVYRASGPDGLTISVTASAVHTEMGQLDEGFTEIDLSPDGEARGELAQVTEALCEALGMSSAEGHTLSLALALTGVEAPELIEDEELVPRESDRLIDAAYKTIRRHFNRMIWNEPGTRLGMDPLHLHDMRVATRRLRSAARTFRDGLPERGLQPLVRDLKWIGDALGRVRDLDVHLKNIERDKSTMPSGGRLALDLYIKEVRANREEARKAMLRELDTERYRGFLDRFERLLAAGPPENPDAPLAQVPAALAGREIILKRLKRVLKSGRDAGAASTDAELHRLRIRCKRLRYACEFLSDLYGSPVKKFAKRVKAFQDILGAHQDAVVARRTLSKFTERIPEGESEAGDLHQAVGQLMVVQARRTAECRAEFADAWERFDRKKVRGPLEASLQEAARRAEKSWRAAEGTTDAAG